MVPSEGKNLQLSDLKKWTNDLLNGKLKLVPMKKSSGAGKESDTEETPGSGSSGNEEAEEVKEDETNKVNINEEQTINGKDRSEL